MKFKMTTEEKNWVLYDVGDSAFVLLVSTIIVAMLLTRLPMKRGDRPTVSTFIWV